MVGKVARETARAVGGVGGGKPPGNKEGVNASFQTLAKPAAEGFVERVEGRELVAHDMLGGKDRRGES